MKLVIIESNAEMSASAGDSKSLNVCVCNICSGGRKQSGYNLFEMVRDSWSERFAT